MELVQLVESSKSNWSGRYSWGDENESSPGLNLNGTKLVTNLEQYMGSNTRVLSPTMVTQTEVDFLVDKLQNLALEQRSTELIRLLRKAARQPGPNAEKSPSARSERPGGTESRDRGERAPRSTDQPS